MDAGHFIDVLMGVALQWEREKTRLMEESLRADEVALVEEELERSMLMENKERMLEEIEIQEKLIDEFMVYIRAVENNDTEIAQNFDEKAVMDAIFPMLKGGHNDLDAANKGKGRDADGGEGNKAGGEGGSCNGDSRK